MFKDQSRKQRTVVAYGNIMSWSEPGVLSACLPEDPRVPWGWMTCLLHSLMCGCSTLIVALEVSKWMNEWAQVEPMELFGYFPVRSPLSFHINQPELGIFMKRNSLCSELQDRLRVVLVHHMTVPRCSWAGFWRSSLGPQPQWSCVFLWLFYNRCHWSITTAQMQPTVTICVAKNEFPICQWLNKDPM